MDKKTEDELKEFVKEKTKWKHFFEILRRKYIWVPLTLVIVYLKESQPLHIPIIDDVIKILSRLGGFH